MNTDDTTEVDGAVTCIATSWACRCGSTKGKIIERPNGPYIQPDQAKFSSSLSLTKIFFTYCIALSRTDSPICEHLSSFQRRRETSLYQAAQKIHLELSWKESSPSPGYFSNRIFNNSSPTLKRNIRRYRKILLPVKVDGRAGSVNVDSVFKFSVGDLQLTKNPSSVTTSTVSCFIAEIHRQ